MTEGNDQVQMDLSAAEEGYVAVAATSDSALKFQVVKEDMTYTYDLSSDGAPEIFPLQSGNGLYTFYVMENVQGTKYALLYETSKEVTLKNEFEPFLRPSQYVRYNEDSFCVQKSSEFAKTSANETELISTVCDYICSNVEYDEEKAKTVTADYVPDPDEVLAGGKGICFDYASLTAAMLRSQGIPVKMIFGYVGENGLYHAWNMVYTEESGWVVIKYEMKENQWNRLDPTAMSAGADKTFIEEGANYTDIYQY